MLVKKFKGGHNHSQFVGDGFATRTSEKYPKQMCQKLAEILCRKNAARWCSTSKAWDTDHQLCPEAMAFPGSQVEMPPPASIPESRTEVSGQQLKDAQVAIKRVHVNSGHPGTLEFLKNFRDVGYKDWVLEELRQFV